MILLYKPDEKIMKIAKLGEITTCEKGVVSQTPGNGNGSQQRKQTFRNVVGVLKPDKRILENREFTSTGCNRREANTSTNAY